MAKVYCKKCRYLGLDCQDYSLSVCFHPSAEHKVVDKEDNFYSPEEFTIGREYCQHKNSENNCEFFKEEEPLTLQMLINHIKRDFKFRRRILKCRFARTKKIR